MIQKLFQITTALDIPMWHLFSGEPGRPSDKKEDKLERLIELLRGLDATDLELFNEMLPRLVEWKGNSRAMTQRHLWGSPSAVQASRGFLHRSFFVPLSFSFILTKNFF